MRRSSRSRRPPAGRRAGAPGGGVGTGSSVLQGTFTIEGSVAKQMLVRGLGPALSSFGVTGVLADPMLEIFHASTGATVATNDDWGAAANATQITTAGTQAGAIPLAAGSKDAATLVAFTPGTYRARLSGVAGTSGVALLEIYEA